MREEFEVTPEWNDELLTRRRKELLLWAGFLPVSWCYFSSSQLSSSAQISCSDRYKDIIEGYSCQNSLSVKHRLI